MQNFAISLLFAAYLVAIAPLVAADVSVVSKSVVSKSVESAELSVKHFISLTVHAFGGS